MCLAGALSLLDMGRSEGPWKEAGWQDNRVHSAGDCEKRQPSSNTERYRNVLSPNKYLNLNNGHGQTRCIS